MPPIKYFHKSNPIHKISPALLLKIGEAQNNSFANVYSSAFEFLGDVIEQLRIGIKLPESLKKTSAETFADQEFSDFKKAISGILKSQNYPSQSTPRIAEDIATRAMLLRAFAHPDAVVKYTAKKVCEVVNLFPKNCEDIEVGRNPGDVLDPFILAATQYLLYEGAFDGAISATVSHKALMMIEGLMGHLHEDILGQMRGNVRIPEPRGAQQADLDYQTNPFPGADLLQPPMRDGDKLRLHQVKSKTGSAKGGDGKRLGLQLKFLKDHYDAEIFYDALIGNTLNGHRSKTAVEREAPSVRVLVGNAAFKSLTGSNHGASLLLRLYHEAFLAAAKTTGYSITGVTEKITAAFNDRATKAGETYLESILNTSVNGVAAVQDSLLFNKGRISRVKKSPQKRKAPAKKSAKKSASTGK